MTEGAMDVTIEIDDQELTFPVDYLVDESSDPGVRTCRNGDPGVPPSGERFISLAMSNRELAAMLNELCEEHGLSRPHPQLVPAIRCRIRAYIEDHV